MCSFYCMHYTLYNFTLHKMPFAQINVLVLSVQSNIHYCIEEKIKKKKQLKNSSKYLLVWKDMRVSKWWHNFHFFFFFSFWWTILSYIYVRTYTLGFTLLVYYGPPKRSKPYKFGMSKLNQWLKKVRRSH